MSFSEYETEHLRLAVLQVLQQDTDYEVNEEVLRRALEAIGHACSRDKLRSEVSWIVEQGLATQRMVGTLLVVTITARGEDVALGRARAPGIARPRPGGA